jgi:DNA-binding LytR/AlgR family response regulator
MERIIIIDDKNCRRELSDFIESNKEHIRFNSSIEKMKNTTRAFFEELASDTGSENKLAVSSNQHIEIVHTRDITHIEATGLTTSLHLSNKSIIEANSTLEQLSLKLKGSNFIRIHNDFMVNLDYFSKLDLGSTTFMLLDNGINLPVDPDKKSLIIKYLKDIESQT